MRLLQAFSDDSHFGIFHTDARGRATYGNPALGEIAGAPCEDLLDHGWVEMLHPGDRQRVLGAWRQAAAARRSVEIACRIVRPDGSRRHVRIRGRALPELDAAPLGFVGVVLDVTDQVLAERRLRKNNVLLSAVLANIPCGVTVYDADGTLVLDNQQFRSLLSLPEPEDDAVISDFGTIAPAPVPTTRPGYPDSGSGWPPAPDFDPAPRVREEVQPDGRVLEVREAPMPTGGLVTTYTDITQHKHVIETLRHAKAEAEQAASAKAAFLAAMSHEIRTPMNGVIGMTHILLDSPLSRDQEEIVQVIRESGESLLVVLNDILDYSKIESGQMVLEWKPFRLGEVVDRSVRLLAPKAQDKKVRIAVVVDEAIPPLLFGDANRLQQVLTNLLSNAVKFTESGEIRISVANESAGLQRQSGTATGDLCTIAVGVQDTGIGIAREKLDTIFDPFVQADSSTARRFGGTGLGLSIARRLVNAMGGDIAIDSALGTGTTVRFTILAEAAVPRSPAARRPATLWGKRALVVAGSRSDPGLLVRQLERWGMEHQACASPAAAMALLRGEPRPDLLVCAMHSAEKHGLELVRTLRAEGIAVPAVLLSRMRLAQVPDPRMGAWVVPRSASEGTLYEALCTALQSGAGEERPAPAAPPQFERGLGERMPLRILVAEDNEINRKVVLRMLRAFGYDADVVHNGAQAVDAVRQRPYDLVLMDLQMPEMDGAEATRHIVRALPRRRPRIVAMSANVMREDVQAALDAGADEYIAKPFPVEVLRAALERCGQRKDEAGGAASDAPPADDLLSLERVHAHAAVDASGEFLQDLVATFIQTSQASLDALEDAVAGRRLGQVRALLHEYSGMCAVIGAQRLLGLALELQQRARAERLEGAAALLRRCRAAQEETAAALRRIVDEKRGSPEPPQAGAR